jgi:hypothetical protein
MTERWQFVRDARQRLVTFTELCALYGISRVTGYKWLYRAEQSGLDFLQELSRRPHVCPHATPPALTARGHRHCLMHVQRDILRRPFHESRSLLWAMGLRQLHGSSKGRALNMC